MVPDDIPVQNFREQKRGVCGSGILEKDFLHVVTVPASVLVISDLPKSPPSPLFLWAAHLYSHLPFSMGGPALISQAL